MKKILIAALTIVSIFALQSCGPSYVAYDQPVYYNRPAAPRAGYVWIEGSWYRSGNRYIQRPGYWAPPKKNKVYRPGTWQQNNNRWHYQKGGWRRH